jgi:hypothetical protein
MAAAEEPVGEEISPDVLRRLHPADFERGPWHLDRWSPLLGWIAVVWVGIITILFLPGRTAQGWVVPLNFPLCW